MRQKFLLILLFVFLTLFGLTQPSNYYYYYNQQQSNVTLSEKVMFVKFVAGLTNTQKVDLINQANVDILQANPSNIPDAVMLKSKILQRQVLYYPCGNPPLEERIAYEKSMQNKEKKDTKTNAMRLPPPCEGCPPPNCDPYYITQSYDNFYEALFFFLDNINIVSASKAVIKNVVDTVGTCEDFFIKIKPAYSINDFTSLINYYSLTATDVSANFGTGVYKISETRGGSRWCMERANIFFETGKCDFSHPNLYFVNAINTADPQWSNQWGLRNTGQYSGVVGADIRVEQAWQITRGNPNIIVAVLDNGVQLNHPDLQANLLPGFDGLGLGSAGGATDGATHGTNTAGIIGAIADNNRGISGIAPDCRILPVRIGEANLINIAAATAGLNWSVDNGASVISNSWGGGFENDLFEQAVNRAVNIGRNNLGCLLFFASGNENNSAVNWPARLPQVMSVGAMNMCNQRKNPNSCDGEDWWGSNYGNALDFVAPSPKITTLTIGDTTTNSFNGTSAACPHASGIAALMLSVNPNLTLFEARRILDYSCNKVGRYCYNWTTNQSNRPHGGWNNETGYGRLNAYNAVQLARAGVTFSNPTYNIASQSNSQVTGNIGVVFGNWACTTTLPFGINFVRRYEVTANVTYPNTLNPVIIASSNGFTAANPNDGRRWADAINVTATSATLRTYVYKGYNSSGQDLGWIPTTPPNISFTYTVVGSPTPVDYQLQRAASSSNQYLVSSKIPFELDQRQDFIINDVPVELAKTSTYPNPTNNVLTIIIDLESKGNLKFDIIDVAGHIVMNLGNKSLVKGTNNIQWNVAGLKSGVYLLRGIDGGKIISYKFMKQ